MVEAGLEKRGSGRKKLKKRKIASDDEEPSETKQDKLINDQDDFEEGKDELEDNEKYDEINNKMSIEELEARMKEIEAKIEGKNKGKQVEKKRDQKKKEKSAKGYTVKEEEEGSELPATQQTNKTSTTNKYG